MHFLSSGLSPGKRRRRNVVAAMPVVANAKRVVSERRTENMDLDQQ